jgi:peptidoglycan hydrolase CwlO-like protein
VLAGAILFAPAMSLADELSDLIDQQGELQSEIAKNQAVIDEKGKLINDLESQIEVFDAQIAKTQNAIALTQNKIIVTTKQIEKLEQDIKLKTAELKDQEDILWSGAVELYKQNDVSLVETFLASEKLSTAVDRTLYLDTIEKQIVETIDAVNKIKAELEKDKKETEFKKVDLQVLEVQQVDQRRDLEAQRSAKTGLLSQTQGEQSQYREYIKQLQQRFKAIQDKIWGQSQNYISLGHVDKGDIIGYIGNTGFSTGCHLHFEVRNSSGQHTNPMNYIGNGYFIDPAPGVNISAGYGGSDEYFDDKFHTGIDKADGCAGTPVRAAAEGEIALRVTGRPNTYYSDPQILEYGNYVKIHHTNGMFTLYAHLR